MRKIIASIHVSLDGFMAGSDGNLDWHFKYWDAELCESWCGQLAKADSILLGRHTYQAFAAYWPSKCFDLSLPRQDLVVAELMNAHQKLVVSSSLSKTSWQNSRILKGELNQEVEILKRENGGDIILLGSACLLQALIKNRLIDRFELWLHPVLIGSGKALFDTKYQIQKLKLLYSVAFNSGVIRLSYGVV